MEISDCQHQCSGPDGIFSSTAWGLKGEPVAETFNLTAMGSKYNIEYRLFNLAVFSSASHTKCFIIDNEVVLVELFGLRVGHSGHSGN